MKKLLLLCCSVVVAGLAGVAAFMYTGKSPSNIVEEGKKLEQKVNNIEQKGRQGLQQAQDAVNTVKSLPIPDSLKPTPPELPKVPIPTPSVQPQPTPKGTTPPVKPPQPPKTPPAPPLEDVNSKDQDQLKGILGK